MDSMDPLKLELTPWPPPAGARAAIDEPPRCGHEIPRESFRLESAGTRYPGRASDWRVRARDTQGELLIGACGHDKPRESFRLESAGTRYPGRASDWRVRARDIQGELLIGECGHEIPRESF
eukprot:2370526-Pyramimonas_sp.AAC.2